MSCRIVALALALCTIALPVSAAPYPDHAVKLIVPFAAGGGTDVLARIIAQNLNSKWGQPVVVDNQPGASGSIGTRAVMKAPPDGYTLLMVSTGALMAVSASAGEDAPFDARFLSPIAIGAAPLYLLVVNPKLPVASTADLIRLANQILPGCSHRSESGVPGYESVGWFGLLAPPNTPPEIVRQINAAIVAAMDTQEFRDHLATLGAEPKPQTPEQFAHYINADVVKWSKLLKDNDVQSLGGK